MKFYSREGTIGGPVGVSDPRRERFAVAALTGLLASPHVDPLREPVERYAVEYADALIAELDKPRTMEVPT